MTIEILPLDLQTLTYSTYVIDEDGNVLERGEFAHDRYIFARRWAKRMLRTYGGDIMNHTAGAKLAGRA